MASSKWSFVYLLFLLIAAVIFVKAVVEPDFSQGKRDPLRDNQKCVWNEEMNPVPGNVSEMSLRCNALSGHRINYAAFWDLTRPNKTKSVVTVTYGGIGQSFIELLIQSEISKRLDFHIQVFCK